MNIEHKLKLSENPNSIYFFREGIFAQVYNCSLYLANTHLNLGLKVSGCRYKKLGDQLVFKGGLPTETLEAKFSNLIKHHWGYEIRPKEGFCSDGYDDWLQANIDSHNNVVALLPLTASELEFLKTWKEGKYSPTVEALFFAMMREKANLM